MRPRPEIENDRTPPSEAQVSHCWLWDRDASGIISLVGLWILHEVGRDDDHGAVDLRRGALAEGGEAQDRFLTNVHLIDRVRRELRLNVERIARGHDLHHFLAGCDYAAHGVYRHLVNGAVLRCADLDAREHVLRRDLLLGRLGYVGAKHRPGRLHRRTDRSQHDAETVVLVTSADHILADARAFGQALETAGEAAWRPHAGEWLSNTG